MVITPLGIVYRIEPFRFAGDDGKLSVVEWQEIPGHWPRPVRHFTIREVPDDQFRGGHAHKQCWQFMEMVSGEACLEVSSPGGAVFIERLRPESGLIAIEPWRWVVLENWTPDGVIVVHASHAYDPHDYIEDWDVFTDGARA